MLQPAFFRATTATLPLLVGLALVPLATAQAQLVAPPTYEADVDLLVERGSFPKFAYALVSSGYNGQGASGAGATAGPVPWFFSQPSQALAEATDTALRASSQSTGLVDFIPGGLPQVRAEARASTTRYFHFGSDWPMTFDLALDGRLLADLSYAEIPGDIHVEVRYRLDWLSAAGALLAPVFEVRGRLQYQGGQFVLSKSAFATPLEAPAWDAAFIPLNLGTPGFGAKLGYDIAWLQELNTWYVANGGNTYGFRWTMETETLLSGTSVAAGLFASFDHTASAGLGLDAQQMQALGITELAMVSPPVPELPTALLLLAGLAAVGARARGGRQPGGPA